MKLDPTKTALLTLDFQNGIMGFCPGAEVCVPRAAKAVDFARRHQLTVIHVGLGLSEGHPEIPDFESPFLKVKQNNLFVMGSASARFLPEIARPGELIVYKQRVGAFSENHLDLTLRSKGIEHLILMGITTSGIVLSTLRRAFDLNYRCVVLGDACFDRDPEVHRVLTEKVFTAQATVSATDAFIAEYGNR